MLYVVVAPDAFAVNVPLLLNGVAAFSVKVLLEPTANSVLAAIVTRPSTVTLPPSVFTALEPPERTSAPYLVLLMAARTVWLLAAVYSTLPVSVANLAAVLLVIGFAPLAPTLIRLVAFEL